MTTDLNSEILLSSLHGESADDHKRILDAIIDMVHGRNAQLAAAGERQWQGDGITVLVCPSSEVLHSHDVGRKVAVLARLGRKAGVSLRLVDALGLSSSSPTEIHLGAFGLDPTLRAMAADAEMKHVTYQQISVTQLIEMAETYGRQTPTQ